jgi:prepilin-type N-terminal cleavage/methylation domain-containing protein
MIGDNKKGFTLIEVMVSVAIFAVIILSMTNIFKLAIDGQRSAIAAQNVQESLKYFLEVTAKEVRMAQKNKNVCPGLGDETIFTKTTNSLGDVLSFKNYYGECVSYFLASDGTNQRFKVSRQLGVAPVQVDYISPARIKINSLHFILSGGPGVSQPVVTINLNANALGGSQFKSTMTLQTSITSRYYK